MTPTEGSGVYPRMPGLGLCLSLSIGASAIGPYAEKLGGRWVIAVERREGLDIYGHFRENSGICPPKLKPR